VTGEARARNGRSMSGASYDFDFAVLGGGPAGASSAISLAQRGHRTVLFESEIFPRFHIGESLLSTANDVFLTLGVAEEIEGAGFPRKWGARLLTHDGGRGRGVDFAASHGIAHPQTWQVPREDFDRILLERARAAGADVREGATVRDCAFSAEAVTVDVEAADRTRTAVRVKAVVDATGRRGLLAKKLSLRKDEPRLANIAIYSHYSGVPRPAGSRPDDIHIIAREDAGWFWLIPISTELTSVGVVLPKNLLLSMPAGSNEERLDRAIADTPAVAEMMRGARRAWPVRAEKDFSYSSTVYAGDRWLLAGDAGSFLDPVFSTGVSIALESGIEAAAALDDASTRGDFSARRFAAYSRRQEKRFRVFRRYVLGFYTPEFRDRFFDPDPPRTIFRSVVTVLAGNWSPGPWTRFLAEVFFASVALQRRFPRGKTRFRRDEGAGYPDRR
jgi:flavin-dependent dehydrogenase